MLLGTTEEPQLTQIARTAFLKCAKKDEETGDYYLDQEDFIDAIAPESEDYVRFPRLSHLAMHS